MFCRPTTKDGEGSASRQSDTCNERQDITGDPVVPVPGSGFWVLGSGFAFRFRFGSLFGFAVQVARSQNPEPNAEREHELRTQNSEQRTLDRSSLITDPLVSCNRERDRRVL